MKSTIFKPLAVRCLRGSFRMRYVGAGRSEDKQRREAYRFGYRIIGRQRDIRTHFGQGASMLRNLQSMGPDDNPERGFQDNRWPIRHRIDFA